MSTTTAMSRPGFLGRWLAKRQFRVAAVLHRRGKLSNAEYAALAIDAVAKLRGEDPRRSEHWDIAGFSIEASFALGVELDGSSNVDLAAFGPYEHAVAWIGEAFPVYDGLGDLFNAQSMTFQWGTGADRLLRRARRHLSAINRTFERLDAWRGEQAEIAPHLHDDAWKLLVGLLGLGVGFVVGRLTAP